MAEQLSTFATPCSGGLFNNLDPLTHGSQFPGSAYKMINYEPALEGGYRRISGFSRSYGELTGDTNNLVPVLGVHISADVQQGVFGARKPASGNNHLHWYNHYYTVAVTNGTGTNLTVGESLTGVVSATDDSGVAATATVISTSANSVVLNFGKLPNASNIYATGNVITGGTSDVSTAVTATPVVIGWTTVTSDVIANDPDGVCAAQTTSGAANLVINGALHSSNTINFTTAASEQPRKVTIFSAGGDVSGITLTVTGTDYLGQALVEVITGPAANATVTSTKYFNTITQIAASGAVTGDITVGSGAGLYRPTAPTMVGVSQVRFENFNWGAPKFTMVDGINPAATYDGSNYIQIVDSNAPTDPTLVAAFNNHLFLSGDAADPYHLHFSSPTLETDFNPANGAGVINVGFKIVQIKAFRDQLYIFGANNIKRLVGDNQANFVLQNVTSNLGCIAPDSVVEFNGELIFLAPDGIRPVSGTDRIGDIELATLSKPVQSIFEDFTANEDLTTIKTVVIKKKSQFRMFFQDQDSLGIIGGIRRSGQGGAGFEFGQIVGIEINQLASGYIEDEEFVIHGDSTGFVYRQETGQDFNGNDIFSFFQTPFVYMEDPEVRKSIYNVTTYMRSEGVVTMILGLEYDYGDPSVLLSNDYTLTTEGAAAYYDNAKYDATEIYDGNPSPIKSTNVSGSGKSVSVKYVTNGTDPSHTIQAYSITYGLGDRR
tara:strand:+ start:116 stop:2266 length:2151 start_codon:yes stop_codon:yes gene_type:complete